MMRDESLDKDFAGFLRTETKSFTAELLRVDKHPDPFSPTQILSAREVDNLAFVAPSTRLLDNSEAQQGKFSGGDKIEVTKEESSGGATVETDLVAGSIAPVEVGDITEVEEMSNKDIGLVNTEQDGVGDIVSGGKTPSQIYRVKSAFATEPSGGGSEQVTMNSMDDVSVFGLEGPNMLSPTNKAVGNEIKKEGAHKVSDHMIQSRDGSRGCKKEEVYQEEEDYVVSGSDNESSGSAEWVRVRKRRDGKKIRRQEKSMFQEKTKILKTTFHPVACGDNYGLRNGQSSAQFSVGFQPMFRPHPVRPAPGVKHVVRPLGPARSGVQLGCPSHDQSYANTSASPATRASLLLNAIDGLGKMGSSSSFT
ncbi:hypothetical protein U1Q18_041092 [Sarracenia purpurea var. burkii]